MTATTTELTPWDAVIGQPAAVDIVRQALARDELAHAWLLVGPAGVGQRELVGALAAALNCPVSDDPTVGCGDCDVCGRIERGAHPAAQEYEPEGAFHVVEAVRSEWIPAATRTLTEGHRKVLRIVAADRMNEAAQNAFLKVLEEPPPSVVWVLDAQDDSLLLDTIVSRCRRLDLVAWGPQPLGALADRLGLEAEARTGLTRAALGSPDRLRALADPDVAAARGAQLAILRRLVDEGIRAVTPVARELTGWAKSRSKALGERHSEELTRLEEAYGVERGRGWPPGVKARLTRRFERLERQETRAALNLALDNLGTYLRDGLAVAAGGDAASVVNVDQLDRVRKDAADVPITAFLVGLEAIATCREALERNGQPELQLERLLLRLALAARP